MRPRGIDVFAGGGGFSTGFTQTGFDIVAAIDIDKTCAATFSANHQGTDFISLGVEEIIRGKRRLPPDIDVIIGGPPCQGFSLLNPQHGPSDPRNFLYRHFMDIIRAIEPEWVLVENVPGIMEFYGGQFAKDMEERLKGFGYKVWWAILNALNYGVPQSRRRFFAIASKGAEWEWPKLTTENSPLTVAHAISDLPSLEAGEREDIYSARPHTEYQKARRDGMKRLQNHEARNHCSRLVRIATSVPEGGAKTIKGRIYKRLSWDRPSGTVTRAFSGIGGRGRFIHPFDNRGLTAREAARLQSFDDSFQFFGTHEQIALQIANAVPPLLAKVLAKQIKKLSEW